ncbi:MAG: hypothetical protein R3C44_24325 [Chloroflexota bacterium]
MNNRMRFALTRMRLWKTRGLIFAVPFLMTAVLMALLVSTTQAGGPGPSFGATKTDELRGQ